MRSLLLFLILASPLLAQDKPKPEKAQIKQWIELLSSEDAAKRKEAMEALRKLGPAGFELVLEALHDKRDGTLVIGVRPAGAGLTSFRDGVVETMRGSVSDGQARVEYTLNSLGGGRYKLSARRKSGDDEATINDEGTMAELQKRHSFLRGMRAIETPVVTFSPPRTRTAPPKPQTTRIKSLGITVRPVSEVLGYHLFLTPKVGYVVESVEKGGHGEKLGLERFDVLTRSGGRWIQSPAQLERANGEIGYLRRDLAPKEQSAKLR